MKQYPAKKKFKKYHKVNYNFSKLSAERTFSLNYGLSGIQAKKPGKLTYKQLEACRKTLRRGLKKSGNIWIRVFTDAPVTKKPVASRMGKVKGVYHTGRFL